MASFLGELRRRNVIKVAVAYAIVAWLVIQIAATVFPVLQIPDWATALVTMLVLLGFPVALILSWAFELTPEGLKPTTSIPRERSITRATGQKLNYIVIGLLATAVVFLVVDDYVLAPPPAGRAAALAGGCSVAGSPPPAAMANVRSIAVLPFENQSAAEENAAFFADGIHGDLITQLTKIRALDKVISRESVMTYRNTDRTLNDIANSLGVANILAGNVQQAGDQLRITVNLIDAATDGLLWAETFRRELTAANIFDIQSEIATCVAATLRATLTPQEVDRLHAVPTENTLALKAYMQGRDIFWSDLDDTATAVQLFTEAVDADSQFAHAWAALSSAHIRQYWLGVDRTPERRQKAEDAIEQARRLAPDEPEVHLARARFLYMADRSYDEALAELRFAEEGLPRSVEVLRSRADILRRMRRFDEAVEIYDTAISLDPQKGFTPTEAGMTRALQRRYAEVSEYFDDALDRQPDYWLAWALQLELPLWREGDGAETLANGGRRPTLLRDRVRDALWRAALFEGNLDLANEFISEMSAEAVTFALPYHAKSAYFATTAGLRGEDERVQMLWSDTLNQVQTKIRETFQDPEICTSEDADVSASLDDPGLCIALGEALAGLGQREEALRAGRNALAMLPIERDTFFGSRLYIEAILRVFAPSGDVDATLGELAKYLSGPGTWSIEGLSRDPRLDSVRADPRFQQMVEEYGRRG